jgi:predicted DNA binding CopG/RHH family protein
MAKKSKNKSLPNLKSEDDVDDWLQKTDLTQYFSGDEFHKVRFAKLEKKLVDEAYDKALESQPVTLRLPQELIQKLKLAAIRQGIAYQTLARLLLQRSVNRLL